MAALTLETRCRANGRAAALNISRTTVASALGQLREEGYLCQPSGKRFADRAAGTSDIKDKPDFRPSVNLATAALERRPEIHPGFPSGPDKMLPQHPSNTGYDQRGSPVRCGRRPPTATANEASNRSEEGR